LRAVELLLKYMHNNITEEVTIIILPQISPLRKIRKEEKQNQDMASQ
jgi:hypothetical protein